MNTLQLAQRLARNLTHTDVATLPVAAALDLVDAANAGLQELWRLLPPIFRTTTVSGVLRAPETVAVTVAARYGTALTGTPFSAANDRGCTVRVNDDPRDNEVTGTSAIRDPFLGQTLTGTASLWHDSFQIYDTVERIVSDVRLYTSDGTWYSLTRTEGLRRGGLNQAWWAGWLGYQAGPGNTLRQAGRPAIYMLEPVGIDQHADSEFFLKVYPMPDADYIIRFEAEIAPRTITLANMTSTAVDMPVRESLANSALVPLCEEVLARSPFWANGKLQTAVSAAADRGRAVLRSRAGDMALPNNTIGTPAGY